MRYIFWELQVDFRVQFNARHSSKPKRDILSVTHKVLTFAVSQKTNQIINLINEHCMTMRESCTPDILTTDPNIEALKSKFGLNLRKTQYRKHLNFVCPNTGNVQNPDVYRPGVRFTNINTLLP